MKKSQNKRKMDGSGSLLLSIIVVFGILGAIVFSVAHKISVEMSASAIQNLSESLDLIESTIEAVLNKEAEFQRLMAQEISLAADQEQYIRTYQKSETMVKVSLIQAGRNEGISNTGEVFSEKELDFSAGGTVKGMPVSQSYVNYMGTWAYTIKCPVIRDGKETATLYVEYIYDSIDQSLPDGFYNKRAMLYIMDAESERMVLKPKGMGERSAGHLNLEDFFRANDILEEELRKEVSQSVKNRKNIMFQHDIRGKKSLIYMWAVNDGTIYLIGYVPIDAIQQEGRTVNQNILIVVGVMLIAFFLCCVLYYFNQREQNRLRREREKEREIHNKQLAEALQAAQIASNSKTMFLSNMSHDIRTPMNAIMGMTSIAAMHIKDPTRVQECLNKIAVSNDRLLSLVNEVLDMSKIESGKVSLSEEAFDLREAVGDAVQVVLPQVEVRNRTLT